MSKRLLCWMILIVLIFGTINTAAADNLPILKCNEIDRHGRESKVNFSKHKYPVVDVNSTIEIVINTSLVRSLAAKEFKIIPPIDEDELNSIISILKLKTKMLKAFGACNSSFNNCDLILDYYSQNMIQLELLVMKIPRLRQKVNETMELELQGPAELEQIFGIVAREIGRLSKLLDENTEQTKVYFRLGGWLIDGSGNEQHIHIPGFDEYNEGIFYEKPSFILPISKQAHDQYLQASEAAESYNKEGFSFSDDRFKTMLSMIADSLENAWDCLEQQFSKTRSNQLLGQNDSMLITIQRSFRSIHTKIVTLREKISAFIKLVQTFQKNKNSFALSSELINSTRILFSELTSDLKSLENDLTDFNELTKDSSVKEKLNKINFEISDKFSNCTEKISRITSNYLSILSKALDFVYGDNKLAFAKANLEFTSKVKRFLLEDIPGSTRLDLRKIGIRNNSDQIHLRAVVEKEDQISNEKLKSIEIDRRVLLMYQLGFHVGYSVGTVFVNPWDKKGVTLKSEFQMVPSYSIFTRWGTRSASFNRIWKPGLGLNIATPDFDQNSNPELGLGLVITLFCDVVQVGVGKNIRGDNSASYWFFGLQLPLDLIVKPGLLAQ